MQRLRTGVLAMACAVGVVSAMTYVSAQRGAAPAEPQRGGGAPGAQRGGGAPGARGGGAPRGEQIRHLVYIATPGDGGTDNQSGVVVLDADKNYSFLKRISYGLPAAEMPGPKNAGIAVSVPLHMLYVTTDGWMKAIDLTPIRLPGRSKAKPSRSSRRGHWVPRAAAASVRGCCRMARRWWWARATTRGGTTSMASPARS